MAVTHLPYAYTTSGSVLSTGATGAAGTSYTASWVQPSAHFNNSNGTAVMTIPHGQDKVILEEKATLEVKGSVQINGVDLEERLNTIETILQIPTRDVTMEDKHPKLKKLYEEYMRELAKYKTWDRIKGEE